MSSLRFHARAYFHGHKVGGTNPSLVGSLGAGNAVIAHDNRFTRWVAGPGAKYFQSPEDVDKIVDSLETDPAQLAAMEAASRARFYESFTQDKVLGAYEDLLLRFAPDDSRAPASVAEPESAHSS